MNSSVVPLRLVALVLVLSGCPTDAQHHKKTRTQWTVRSLRDELAREIAGGGDCKEVSKAMVLKGDTRDAWGSAIYFDCDAGGLVVSSGPDRIRGNADDIRAP
jgi:hypothetical protein